MEINWLNTQKSCRINSNHIASYGSFVEILSRCFSLILLPQLFSTIDRLNSSAKMDADCPLFVFSDEHQKNTDYLDWRFFCFSLFTHSMFFLLYFSLSTAIGPNGRTDVLNGNRCVTVASFCHRMRTFNGRKCFASDRRNIESRFLSKMTNEQKCNRKLPAKWLWKCLLSPALSERTINCSKVLWRLPVL